MRLVQSKVCMRECKRKSYDMVGDIKVDGHDMTGYNFRQKIAKNCFEHRGIWIFYQTILPLSQTPSRWKYVYSPNRCTTKHTWYDGSEVNSFPVENMHCQSNALLRSKGTHGQTLGLSRDVTCWGNLQLLLVNFKGC